MTRSIWATKLVEELSQDDPGPPTHKWWPALWKAWERAALADIESATLLALAISLIAEEIGDNEMRGIAHAYWRNSPCSPNLTIEMRDALAMRALASKRRGVG